MISEGLYAIPVSLTRHQKVLVRDKFICEKQEENFLRFAQTP